MEDKNLYNKVMLIAFCIILVLLGAGMYSRSVAAQRALENYVPRGNVQELQLETRYSGQNIIRQGYKPVKTVLKDHHLTDDNK